MKKRRCTCGADVNVVFRNRRADDGTEERVCYVLCPVCGQFGPSIRVADQGDEAATAEAIAAWNAMIARLRPYET